MTSGCIRCASPMEPHFVHLSWAIRRLTATQLKYIRIFYGESALAAIRPHPAAITALSR